ncbi:sensor histidine kinase [Streptomyces sp. NPDC017056]|uniref:sensor histidine kinase n=1 Tax=Streptomyces sp. NPDC017056 TaxID=3364973 RepID=UPI0037A59ED9
MISRIGAGAGTTDVRKGARAAVASPRLLVTDVLLWAMLTGAGVLWWSERTQASLPVDLLLPALVLAIAVPGSRRWPGAAVLLANGLCALGLASPGSPANPYLLALAVLSGLLGHRSAGVAVLGVFGACLAADLVLCALLQYGVVHWFYTVTLLPLAMVLPWLTGRYWRARQDVVHGGWHRAYSLEKEQEYVAERARLRERTRIASDMHDSLGHELSLIALRAGALELSPTLAGQDRSDLAELRSMVADAVDHLRDTVGVLREDAEAEPAAEAAGAWAPAASGGASVESVEQLVRRARESGVTVELCREGEGPALTPLVDRAVYRVVQESLTNAVKHAPGSAVRVRIARGRGRTEVRVSNSAPPAGAAAQARTGGHGLAGLRERVLMLGGTLRAAPSADGFDVVASLPDRVRSHQPGDAGPRARAAEPVSVRRLASAARRRARLRFALASAVPAGVGLVTLVSAGLLGYQLSACVLQPADYAVLRVGAVRQNYEGVLPRQPFRYPSDHMKAQPAPAGAACEYYRSNINLLEQVDVYRLCWSGSRLVAKDVLSARPGVTRRGAGA